MPVAAILVALGITLIPARTVDWSQLYVQAPVQVATAQALEAPPTTPPLDIHALAQSEAEKYHLNAEHFKAVIACESGWQSDVQSAYTDPSGPNGREDSWGISQWHLPSMNLKKDGTILTKEDALNPTVALDTMAWYFATGRAYKWSCYNNMYGSTAQYAH